MDLETFVENIEGFYELTSSNQIEIFAYYLLIIEKNNGFKPIDVSNCFKELNLSPYSNIPKYLLDNYKTHQKKQIFLKRDGFYYLEKRKKKELDELVGKVRTPKPSNNLFPLTLFENTRGYLEKVAEQAIICYDSGVYDASLVMIRKALETLIIEVFEKYGISDDIKDADGNFFMLGTLIDRFQSRTEWNLGREVKKALPKIKALGDRSAHNRRFVAKKPDIDAVKTELRLVFEELVHLADF
ncbi:hypothetical protein [Flagellimonas sp.]|uniref:hypothetical protein n=1 Tax=Flagellimonas sp. TaxID=2058762 RepID=UPI003B52675A